MTSAAPPRDTSEMVASNGTGIADKVPSSRARPRARRLRLCRDDCRRHRAVLLPRARPRRAALARRADGAAVPQAVRLPALSPRRRRAHAARRAHRHLDSVSRVGRRVRLRLLPRALLPDRQAGRAAAGAVRRSAGAGERARCRLGRGVARGAAGPRFRGRLAQRRRRADEARAVNRWLAELWLLGAGAVAFVLFFASLLHVPWSRWMVIAAL